LFKPPVFEPSILDIPWVHFLAPDFPFAQLFDCFEDDDDRVDAEAPVAKYVAETKEQLKRR
jgi:hypothetical protein